MPAAHRKPFWLYPNLLSLDAPLVAVAWLYAFAKTWRVDFLPWAAYLSLGLVVWIIYVVDRLLDASMHDASVGELDARHAYHRKHESRFRFWLKMATVIVLILVTAPLKLSIFGWAFRTGLPLSVYNYGLMGGGLVAGFFAISFFSNHQPGELPYAKNCLAGISFAFGTGMVAHVYTGFEMDSLLSSPELICFAVLCVIHIFAIDLWQHAKRSDDLETKASDELALTLPLVLLGASALVYALKDEDQANRPFFYAILTGAALMHVLNRNRSRFTVDALRVLADAALLAPLVVFIAASKS